MRIGWIAVLVTQFEFAAFAGAPEPPGIPEPPGTLETVLRMEGVTSLANAARTAGNAQRGAILFHQPFLGCAKCHPPGAANGTADSAGIGPDLSRVGPETTFEHLVESLLEPSKVIRKGFESVQIETTDGRIVSGILVDESASKVAVRDASTGELIEFARSRIEGRRANPLSLMPAGQVNQLASRQQFLDVINYLAEIAAGGPARSVELRPAVVAPAVTVPEYERRVDHAAFLEDWSTPELAKRTFQRGEAIYLRLCVNCHGTKDQPGSLPTSLRFATGTFKNGSDPFRLYQTLTHGFGLMVGQSWMVPQQKYDVIHYIREQYLRSDNRSQYLAIEPRYLATLPKGDTRGPAPSTIEPWSAMDYGTFLIGTYEAPGTGVGGVWSAPNLAHKGIAMRLDSGSGGVARGRHWMIFEHDTLRMSAVWSALESNGSEIQSNFIDWQGINFNGAHQIHPKTTGTVRFGNPPGPGWADPRSDRFEDPRIVGRDQRRYGPLPSSWGKFHGVYQYGEKLVLSYQVGETDILEMPGIMESKTASATPGASADGLLVTRRLRLGSRPEPLTMLVATASDGTPPLEVLGADSQTPVAWVCGERGPSLAAAFATRSSGLKWELRPGGALCLHIPAGEPMMDLTIGLCTVDAGIANRPGRASADLGRRLLASFAPLSNDDTNLQLLTQGGPRRWPELLTAPMVFGAEPGPFAVDTIQLPVNNPWHCQLRPTGFDFFRDGDRAAVCTWDGDVWLLRGLLAPRVDPASERPITWQRIASGLFQPLGLKIVDGQIFVTCRDQLVVLRDWNGDGETDFYQCFNSDHQVTEHFHEFAMGLQVDNDGNFYYAKSARHALPAVVPHHGTLLRVSKDGSTTDIIANGFRAANGVCLNPDGSFVVTDQEGHWNPKNRINWVRPPSPGGRPRFYGNMFGYHDVSDASDSAMEQPLCWITNAFDRSPSELLWVPNDRWGPLAGSLMNFSYGYGKIHVVPFQSLPDGRVQGGMCELPVGPFPTGIMRGRFHPTDGQLYVCGMFAWAGNATQPGGFYRIRYTQQPVYVPVGLEVNSQGIQLTFTGPLDRRSVEDVANFAIKTWSLKRTENYGSQHYDERTLSIQSASLSDDGRIVRLQIRDIAPTWCMSISFALTSREGTAVRGVIHNTIHDTPKGRD